MIGQRAGGKETAAPRCHSHFHRRLAGAVGIVAPQRIVLSIGLPGLAVEIDLIGGDHHHRRADPGGAHRLHQVDRSGDVGGKGFGRLGIAFQHQRLRGEVEHELRAGGLECCRQRRGIAHIADRVSDPRRDPGLLKQTGIGRRGQRIAMHLRAQPFQPQAQPRSLEAGMSGDKHPAAAVNIAKHQRFQGAWPLSHISLSIFHSR